MIFSEFYSVYYHAVAEILSCVIRGETDEKVLQETVKRCAFSESVLTILPSLKGERWQLLRSDMTTPIRHVPSMPLTLLEKRWLKSISLDPRIHLFNLTFTGLEDVEPLFTPEDYVLYDQYADGDPYLDEEYILRFRTILAALREKRPLKIEMVNRKGNQIGMTILPTRLEYSEKDDKFRLVGKGNRHGSTINLVRIVTCKQCSDENFVLQGAAALRPRTVTLKLLDDRNALERCMLHFAHFEKQVERIDPKYYLVRIRYDKEDETELVIRILGFGPFLEVIEPESFRRLIIERLQRQKSCGLS